MIETLQIWVAKCDYPHCTEVVRMDSKNDLRVVMGMGGWKETWDGKSYCYKHVQSDKRVKLEHSKEKLVYVHSEILCKGQPCAIHNRTDHIMRKFPQHWRDDRRIIERICPHGVGHLDWDSYPYYYEKYGKQGARAEFIHGCCQERCCQPAPEWIKDYA